MVSVFRKDQHRSRARITMLVVVALLLSVFVAPGAALAKDKRQLEVMTRNIYLGSSLAPAIAATDQVGFLLGVAEIYGNVLSTNFPARAEAIADEIETSGADLIGLQEVSMWTTTGPAPGGFDFLDILQEALSARGLDYSVGAVSYNASIGPVPLVVCASQTLGACTLTFQDRDVILVNNDTPGLVVDDWRSGLYEAQAVLDTPVGPLSFDRGWAWIDGTFEGKKFRFVNTHLETEDAAAVQEAQAREFLAGPANTGGAVIAVGDFNSAADGSTTDSYSTLTKSYFDDAWDVNPGDPGLTCCQNGLLDNSASELETRIDLVLTHAASRSLAAEVIGAVPFQDEPPLWASDHAGVVATIRIH